MGRTGWTASALALALASPAVFAQSLSPELQKLDAELPGDLINDPTRVDWGGYGNNYESEGVQNASIPGGGAARRFTLNAKGAEIYSVATNVPLLADVKRGEVVTVGFYARTIAAETSDGQGVLGVRFQQDAAPYGGFGDKVLSIGKEWKWHEVTATADKTIKRSEAIVAYQLAGAKQTIEIGQTIVVKGSPTVMAMTTRTITTAEPELPPQLAGAGQLINRPAERNWAQSGAGGTWTARAEPKIWLGQATRYVTPAAGSNAWDLGTAIPISESINEGDKLLIAIAARTESASTLDGKAVIGLRVQGSEPPYEGFAENEFTVGPNWQLIRIRTTATKSFAPGTARLALHFAGAAQAVDVGPVYILKTP